jgi:hypothetical protein
MRLITLLTFCVIVPSAATATAIVVIWTPGGAIFGADAKLVTDDGKDAGTGCKIGQVSNNILFAESGILAAPSADIDFRSTILKALGSDGTLDQRIVKIESEVGPLLTGILNAPSIKKGVLYTIRKGRPAEGLQVVIVTNDGSPGSAVALQFVPTRDGAAGVRVDVKRTNCPEDAVCNDSRIFTLGRHKAMDREVKRHPDISKSPPVDFVTKLLTVATGANPKTVGPPFSIAFITPGQISWPSTGACKAN